MKTISYEINSPLTQEEESLISDMWESVSKSVDSFYRLTELRKDRPRLMNHSVDTCQEDIATFNSFAEVQNYFILKHLEKRPAAIHFLAGVFDMPAGIDKLAPTSLISHEMCPIDRASLVHSIQEQRVPDADTILKLNEFSNISNELRKNYLTNPTYENKLNVSLHWARLAKCLSYTESLTTADSNSSKQIAARYAPSDYRKPAGVAFYIDEDAEDPILNIGTYQFDPDSTGNVRACIRQWNGLFPKCAVSLDADEDEMIRTMGSEIQAFNIFCGINKIHQTFSVQVNTSNPIRTHLANNTNNSLRPPDKRCVTINFRAGIAYNHFGPFQNSTGNNLKSLMGCYFD